LKGDLARLQEEIDRGGSNELVAELAATNEAIAEATHRLHDVQAQAEEMRIAMQQEKDLKYAKAFAVGTKLARERRLITSADAEKKKLQLELRGKSSEVTFIKSEVDQLASANQVLQQEEEAVTNGVLRKQSQINFWKDTSTKLVMLEEELRDVKHKKEQEARHRECDKRLVATIAAMGNEKLRKELQADVANQRKKHANRMESVIRKHAQDYQYYADESCKKQQRLETEVDHLQHDVKSFQSRLKEETYQLQRNSSRLEKEIAFQGREIIEQTTHSQQAYNKLVNTRTQQFDEKLSQLKADCSRINTEYEIKHEMKMNELANQFERLAVEAQGDTDDISRRGEIAIRNINTYWEGKIQILDRNKRAEMEAYSILNEETKEFIETVFAMERMRTVSVEAVERALRDPRFRNISERKDYNSVAPSVYSLYDSGLNYVPTSVISGSQAAYTPRRVASATPRNTTPRLIHTTRVTSRIADTHAIRFGERAGSFTPRTPNKSANVSRSSSPMITHATKSNRSSPMLIRVSAKTTAACK
jgi:hypothetical protein